jgi:hypothetical protein
LAVLLKFKMWNCSKMKYSLDFFANFFLSRKKKWSIEWTTIFDFKKIASLIFCCRLKSAATLPF